MLTLGEGSAMSECSFTPPLPPTGVVGVGMINYVMIYQKLSFPDETTYFSNSVFC